MTPRQAELFAFIREQIECGGSAPNLETIAARFGFSKPRASVLVTELVEQGALERSHRGTSGLKLPGRVDLTIVGTEQLRAELARRGLTMDALERPKLLWNEGRSCAANHCTARVGRGMLMCREHWLTLPARYRSSVMNAWAARQMQAYQEAVEAARDYLGGYTRVVERVG